MVLILALPDTMKERVEVEFGDVPALQLGHTITCTKI